MRDESGDQYLQLPQIVNSPKQSNTKRDEFNISYSQGKVSFGTKKRGQSEDPTAQNKAYTQQQDKTTTKEDKIRQILMNEDPDFATAEKELNFLSNIAEVRSLGFDRFRYHINSKNNPGNNSSMNAMS